MKRKDRAKRPRRITHGVPTIIEGYVGEQISEAENAPVWTELGLSACKENEYHMTNYWLNHSDQPNSTPTKNQQANERFIKRGYGLPNKRKPDTTEFSYDSKMKSIIAHIISADEYSLIIEREDDSPHSVMASLNIGSQVLRPLHGSAHLEENNRSAAVRPGKYEQSDSLSVDDIVRSEPSRRPLSEVQCEEEDIYLRHVCIEQHSQGKSEKSLIAERLVKMNEAKEECHSQQNDLGNRLLSAATLFQMAAKKEKHFMPSPNKSTQRTRDTVAKSNRAAKFDKMAASAGLVVRENENAKNASIEFDLFQPPDLRRRRGNALVCSTHSSVEDSEGVDHSKADAEAFQNEELDRGTANCAAFFVRNSENRIQQYHKFVDSHHVGEDNRKRERLSSDKDLFSDMPSVVNCSSPIHTHDIAIGQKGELRNLHCTNEIPLGSSMDSKSEKLDLTSKNVSISNCVLASGDVREFQNAPVEEAKKSPKYLLKGAVEEDERENISSSDGFIHEESSVGTAAACPPSLKQREAISEVASSDTNLENGNARNTIGRVMANHLIQPLPTLQKSYLPTLNNQACAPFINESSEMGGLSMGSAFEEFRRSIRIPFSTSTPLRPGAVLCSPPFESSKNTSPLAPIRSLQDAAASLSKDVKNESKAAKNTLGERSDVDDTIWRSESMHSNGAICSSAYWGIMKKSMLSDQRIVGKQEISRNLSIHEDGPDRIPFFLSDFPWTKSYAKKRDFKQEVIFLCGQQNPLKWSALKKVLDLSNPTKLGEGSYGEVFAAKYNDEPVALKIIPTEGSVKVNNEPQNSFKDVQLELVVSRELTELAVEENGYRTEGFIRLITSCVSTGRYPKKLLSAWHEYNTREKSYNDDPRIFPANQCYLILAYEQGGNDLENYDVKSINQAYSIIMQIITALAVAEDRLWYEHRDLHVGNVLISECGNRLREELLVSQKVRLWTWGASVKIIDFTYSRLRKGTSTIFLNLANDEALFGGNGDLQFDIYRLMRKANRNNWARFNPKTNVMWIVYLTRYIYKKLEDNDVGTAEQRECFVRFFQSIHRFDGSLSEWTLHSSRKLPQIIEVEQ